ncbi:CvpA family protein [Paenibacillus sp. J2TS4]|uniref:CvpA family protein n=1 Tax=Paenibacillus sp. J2TS4 TaxID=2807194 RepID=UPI001BCB438B|nr:CvpA family protein [Paenibacillus sp. J2TS4]
MMNIVDLIVAVTIIASFAAGYRKGLISQLVSVVGLVAAILAAFFFYANVAGYLAKWIPLKTFTANSDYEFLLDHFQLETYIYNAIAFVLLFFVVKIGWHGVGRLLHAVVKVPGLNGLNRWAGAILAMLEAFLILTLLVFLLIAVPSDPLQEVLEQSAAVPYLLQWPPLVMEKLPDLFQFPEEDKVEVYRWTGRTIVFWETAEAVCFR